MGHIKELPGCPELLSCSSGLKFEYVGLTVFATLVALTLLYDNPLAWSEAIYLQKRAMILTFDYLHKLHV